ncbi:MAG TPA: Gfo/Idh/MocA family oxidoreductase [Acidimicrobiia bacterium]|nr:Gfo/Idh/MocA family oxidoreductase [Acidimicrobiia bacterium]
MTEPVSWGVLGVAGIAVHKVIPAMQKSQLSPVRAIASRSEGKAEAAAAELGIGKAYASYESLLTDPEIEAVYIPLPNHLHAEWTEKAAAAGKHVLCEKPLAMSSDQARHMIDVCGDAGVKLMEAFMYRLHPLWVETRRLVDSGLIGDLLAIQSFFSYRNVDPLDIRNIADYGGGALMDVGCYPVNVARMLFGSEPSTVKSAIRRDTGFGTDVVTSAVLDFGGRHATFTCSTQLESDQSVLLVGTTGRLEIEIPFNIPPDRPTRLLHFAGGDPPVSPHVEVHEFAAADQYGIQADAFSRAIREGTPVPTDPTDAVANLVVMERIVANAHVM